MDWIVRFIHFHRMRSRDDLLPAEPKIEAFLTHLAVEGNNKAGMACQVPSTTSVFD